MEKLKSVFARVMGINEKKITANSSPETVNEWDSFNSLMLISELEKNFSISFTTDEIVSIKKFDDIKKCLMLHGVQKNLLE